MHASRRLNEEDLYDLVERYVSRDPIPAGRQAHLFLVADPQPGRPDMLREIVTGDGWQPRLINLRAPAVDDGLLRTTGLRPVSPNLSRAELGQHRQDGKALVSGFHQGRSPYGDKESVIELEFSEDGQVRLYCSRLSYAPGGETSQELGDMLLVLLVRQVMAVVVAVSDRVDYLGSWGLGVACTGVRDLIAAGHKYRTFVDIPPYTDDEYRNVTFASYEDLTKAPGAVTDALIGRFLRALDVEEQYSKALRDS